MTKDHDRLNVMLRKRFKQLLIDGDSFFVGIFFIAAGKKDRPRDRHDDRIAMAIERLLNLVLQLFIDDLRILSKRSRMDMVLEAFLINGWIDIAKTKSSSSLDPLFVKRSAINELSSKKSHSSSFLYRSFISNSYISFVYYTSKLSYRCTIELKCGKDEQIESF